MDLNKLRDEAYQIAKEHGWHDKEYSDSHWLMLLITEIAEAVQAHRKGDYADDRSFELQTGVSKGYVTQLLNGDYDHRMSKFFDLSLSFGVIPVIDFIPVEQYIELENRTQIYTGIKIEANEIEQWSDSDNKYSYKAKLSSYNQILKKVA